MPPLSSVYAPDARPIQWETKRSYTSYQPLVPSKPLKRQRTVAFSPDKTTDQVYNIPNLHEYSVEEVTACWYSQVDMKTFKKEAKHAALMFATGSLLHDTDEFCRRGTEWRTRDGAKHRKRNKEQAMVAVLEEQALMTKQYGSVKAEILGQVYQCFTRESRDEARGRGVLDARDARSPQQWPFNSFGIEVLQKSKRTRTIHFVQTSTRCYE